MRNVESGVPQFVTCYTEYINCISGHLINPHDHLKQLFWFCRQPPPDIHRSMAWIGSHSLRKASVRYMGIDVFVTHPDYKVSNNGYVNDIALVKLKKKIKFSKDVSPVKLPEPSDIFSTSSDCWIIGWGNVGTNGMSSERSSTLTQPHRFSSMPSLPPPHSMMHVCIDPLPYPETLQQLKLHIIPQSECKQKNPELTDDMLCAGDMTGGKGPCEVSYS